MHRWTIISGGQTGVDQAALDVARELRLKYGGYVPKGRVNESGSISLQLGGMVETDSADPAVRTEANVKASDATLLFTRGKPAGGTLLTIEKAVAHAKPYLHIDLSQMDEDAAAKLVGAWLRSRLGCVLNVAGPRASEDADVGARAAAVLRAVFRDPDPEPLSFDDQEALANFRHWDTVRWNAVFWYCGLAAGAFAFLLSQDAPPAAVILSGAGLGILGLLCRKLVANTVLYHQSAFPKDCAAFGGRWAGRNSAPPFSLDRQDLRTATQWAQILIVGLAATWLLLALLAAALLLGWAPPEWMETAVESVFRSGDGAAGA